MFTGIIEEIGKISNIKRGARSAILSIQASKVLEDAHLGDSIAVNGVCLTVTTLNGDVFTADIMNETLSRSSLGSLRAGSPVNLERAMAAGGRFGGHIVSGHIDGTGRIASVTRDDNAVWFRIMADKKLLRYIVEKGSIAIDGISLTVAKTDTIGQTILGTRKVGDTVNLENDIIGKYVEKLMQNDESGVTLDLLAKNGFM